MYFHMREHASASRVSYRKEMHRGRASSSRQRQHARGWVGWHVVRAGAFGRHRGRTRDMPEGRGLEDAAIGGRQQRARASRFEAVSGRVSARGRGSR